VAPASLWGAIVSMTDRSSSMTGAATGGGGTAISSTSTAMTSPSPTCTGSGSTYEGWEWGSEGAARTLSTTRFRGTRLRMSVSTRLQKRLDKVEERASRKTHDNGSKDENLHLGTDPGPLHRIVRRALLGGCTLGADRLGGYLTSSRRLDGGAALPRLLGGCPSNLRRGRGLPLAPACSMGNLYVRVSAAPDHQRLKAPQGDAEIRLLRRARRRC
jgi:hypothetical protein